MAIPTRAELDARIREQLAKDPGFRDTLLADPKAAIGGLLGITLPAMVTVEVHQETLTHIHLTLPAAARRTELADQDLELVAGGGCCWANDCDSCGH